LAELAPTHRAVLTLRYLDDLPVGDVATTIGRTVHATEALLTRAKAANRNHAVHILHTYSGGQETS
jgi:RNA polymerase sigma-70 factor (ECF subfamily)